MRCRRFKDIVRILTSGEHTRSGVLGQLQAPPHARIELEPEFEARWPGASRLASACFINLFVLNGQLTARSERWARREGYPSSAAFNVLTVLHGATSPLQPSEIAARVLVSRPTITGILDSLESRGDIRRVPHPGDGRMRLVAITGRARRRVEDSMRRLHLLERRLFDELSSDDQRRMLGMMGRLQAAVDAVPFD